MLTDSYTIHPVAECSIMLRFEQPVSPQSLALTGHVADLIRFTFHTSIMNVTPAYCSILVDYLPYRISEAELVSKLHALILQADDNPIANTERKTIILPTYYAHEVGPDIAHFECDGLPLDKLIELHTAPIYTVSAIGFAPSFAFLSGLDKQLERPRLKTPRVNIHKGSVGIADQQTAVYPNDSPGGWNIIGNCPIELYRPDGVEICPFSIGDHVRFEPIDKQTFLSLGGLIEGEL